MSIVIPQNGPAVLVLPVTDACPGRCTMCGIWRRPKRPDLSAQQLAEILEEGLGEGLTHVNVTGGEPLMHPGLERLASVLSDHCPRLREVNLSTTGQDPDTCERAVGAFRRRLTPRAALQVTISLDGPPEVHDRVRGVLGAYRQAAESIRRCLRLAAREAALAVHANCTISRLNYRHLRETIGDVRRLGVGLSVTYAATNDLYLANSSQRSRFVPDPSELNGLLECLREVTADHRVSLTERHFVKMLSGMLRGEPRAAPCVFQNRGVFLDLDRMLHPCGTAGDLAYGRLGEEALSDVFRGSQAQRVRTELKARYCPKCVSNSYYGLADGVWLEVLRERRRHGVA